MQAHLPERLQKIAIHGKAVKTLDHSHQNQQVAIDDNEQQHGHMAKKARHGTDLSIGSRVKE